MILEVLIFILSTIVCYCLYSYKKLHGYFEERGIRFLPGTPLFGNNLKSTFMRKHFLDEIQDIYNAFPEDKYVGLFELTTPIILIKDPEVIKNIVVKDFDHFTDHREFFSEELDPLFGGSLLLMKGDRWRDMRSTLSPAFTSSKMKFMLPFINDITKNIIEYLNENQNQDIDVDDLTRRYTNDVIASAAFGLEVNSFKDRDNDFYRLGSGMFKLNLRQRTFLLLNSLWPELAKKLGLRFFEKELYTFFLNLVATTMEYRKKEKVDRPDMIQLLMEAKTEWTTEELAGQVFIFFSAGFDTSATALVFTIHELAINQHIQEKLYQECRKLKEEKELTFDNLAELKYMDAIISETLRIWCPAIILDRTCTKAYELPPAREGGKPYIMQPGEILYNVVNQVQLDPKYWPDPYKFDPERFTDENKHNITPYTYMPFGIGPRGCIGMRFAMMELKVLLYHLVLNFKVVKSDKTQDPIKLEPLTFNLKSVGGSIVRFERRQSE